MVSSVDLVFPPVLLVAYFYAAYWAFNIRRALAVRTYRRQALGIGLVAASFMPLLLSSFLNLVPAGFYLVPLFSAFMIIFYWIDASALAARASDPLFRDTLYWSKLRIILWALNTITIGTVLSVILYFLVSGGNVGSFDVLAIPAALGFFLVGTSAFVPIISGAVFLPIIAQRSRDLTLRRHLRWFGLFVVFLFLLFPLGALTQSNNFLNVLSFFVALLGGGYSLYRSAKSLVPLNRISVPDTRSVSEGERLLLSQNDLQALLDLKWQKGVQRIGMRGNGLVSAGNGVTAGGGFTQYDNAGVKMRRLFSSQEMGRQLVS